jgi:hypothetical protein
LLTRNDDLWLADGVDGTPADTQVNLLEKCEKELGITGTKLRLMSLASLDPSIGDKFVCLRLLAVVHQQDEKVIEFCLGS